MKYFIRKLSFSIYDFFTLRTFFYFFYLRQVKRILSQKAGPESSEEPFMAENCIQNKIYEQKELIAKRALFKKRIWENSYRSSGSTGIASEITRNKIEDAKIFAYAEALRSIHGFSARKPYIMIWGRSTAVDKSLQILEKKQSLTSFSHQILSYSVSADVVTRFVKAIEVADQVYGYAYSVDDICVRLNKDSYQNYKPLIFCLTCERVEPILVKNIHKVFPNSKVIVEYGAVEFGVIGITDPRFSDPHKLFLPKIRFNYQLGHDRHLILKDSLIGGIFFKNYFTGDITGEKYSESLQSTTVENIDGRSAEMISYKDVNNEDRSFHTVLIYHILLKYTEKEFTAEINGNSVSVTTTDVSLPSKILQLELALNTHTEGIFDFKVSIKSKIVRKKLSSGKQVSVWSN